MMSNCNYCNELHTNGSRFCSRKCRTKKIEENRPKYQKLKKFVTSLGFTLESYPYKLS